MSKILLVIMLITCHSCNTTEVKPFQDYQYRTVLKKVDVHGEEFISLKDSICEKRLYRVWEDKIGAMEVFKPAPIEECFLLFGNRPTAYSNLLALMEYVRKQISSENSVKREEGFIGEVKK